MSLSISADGDSRRRALDDARHYITSLITLKQVKPGERLPAAGELGRRIGVSRPIVLAALKVIAQEGRISVRPGRAGTVVLRPDGPGRETRIAWIGEHQDVILQMARLREMIEPGIARLAAERGLTRSAISGARRVLRSMDGVTDDQTQRALDAAFHGVISEAIHMPVLHDLSREARKWVSPAFDVIAWPAGRWQASIVEHIAMLDALIARDPTAAAAIALEHVALSTELIQRLPHEAGFTSSNRRISQSPRNKALAIKEDFDA